jgi:hypothetical protein
MTRPGAFSHEVVEWDAWGPEEVTRLLVGLDAPWYGRVRARNVGDEATALPLVAEAEPS